jgi:ABC-type branched-subunit amino acid transport system substrate-binding protein
MRPYSDIPPEPPRLYSKAEDALRRGDYQTAVNGFRAYLTRSEDRVYHYRARFQLAYAQQRLGDYQAALATLNELEAEFPDRQDPQTIALRGDAHLALGDRTEAFIAWEQAWGLANAAERAVLEERMNSELHKMNEEELREIQATLTRPEVKQLVAERLPEVPPTFALEGEEQEGAAAVAAIETLTEGELYTEEGALYESDVPVLAEFREPLLEEGDFSISASGVVLTELVSEELEEAPSPAEEEEKGPVVAALLPLTGPDAAYGQRALSGLRLAFSDTPDMLLVRDTGADAEMAADVFRTLAAKRNVLAVIGPLRASEAEVVAPIANQLELPLVLLSQREGLDGSYVFQTSMTRRQQVRALVEHATQAIGARRFGIVYPDDGYGRNFRDLFSEEAKRLRGSIVDTQSYPPGTSDFSNAVASVRRWARAGGLDAVFIPDAAPIATQLAAELRIVAPQLALLGTESWNHPQAIELLGGAIDGAVFADAFFIGSERQATQSFVERFREHAGRLPTVFEAQAFDAGMLVRQAMEGTATRRDEIVSALRGMGPYEGTSRLLATRDGFERELFLLRVQRGRVVEVSG